MEDFGDGESFTAGQHTAALFLCVLSCGFFIPVWLFMIYVSTRNGTRNVNTVIENQKLLNEKLKGK